MKTAWIKLRTKYMLRYKMEIANCADMLEITGDKGRRLRWMFLHFVFVYLITIVKYKQIMDKI